MDAVCKFCKQPFSYTFKQRREVEREVCDPCRESRRRWARKKVRRRADRALAKLRTRRKVWKRLQVSAKDFAQERKQLAPGEWLPREVLAQKLGMSERAVRLIEEQALKKLRGSTLLWEAYDKVKQTGGSLGGFMEELAAALRERDEARVLDMQQELLSLWERHDALRRLGLELDDWLGPVVELNEGWPEWSAVQDGAQSTMLAAAAEMKVLIMKAQKALMRELGKIPFVEPK